MVLERDIKSSVIKRAKTMNLLLVQMRSITGKKDLGKRKENFTLKTVCESSELS